MNLQATTRLEALKKAHGSKTSVALTHDEIVTILKMRQGNQMTFAGLDPEFELEFARGVMELHEALVPRDEPAKKKKPAAKKKAPADKKQPGQEEIIVRNQAED